MIEELLKGYFVLTTIKIVFLSAVVLLGFGLIRSTYPDQLLEEEFHSKGISVPGRIVGYEWWSCGNNCRFAKSGFIPVVSYITKTGQSYQNRANEYHHMYVVANEKGKADLIKENIVVTYLPEHPEMARVEAWYKSNYLFFYFFGSGSILFGLIFLLILWRQYLRQELK